MLIELKKLEGMAVGALNEGIRIGAVSNVVVNPNDIRLIGFVVRFGSIFPSTKVVSFLDVVDIDRNGLVINSRDSLVDVDEVVRIGELVKKRFSLIGLPVGTKAKKSFGRVSDAVVETTTGDVLRIYTKRLFHDFVFERSQIEKINLSGIIVRDASVAESKKILNTRNAAEPA